MKCPKCNVTLLLAERQGVEIDYCPDCRGIWLDRGELDKIIDKVAASEQAPPQQASAPQQQAPQQQYAQQQYVQQPPMPQGFGGHPGHDPRRDNHYGEKPKHYKKKNILEDLFDF